MVMREPAIQTAAKAGWAPAEGSRVARVLRLELVRRVGSAVLAAALVAGVVWLIPRPQAASSYPISVSAGFTGEAPRVGRMAPDFDLLLLDGTVARLSDYRGHPVWISFWATWCPPCRAENSDIQDLYDEFGPSHGLVVLAPSVGESPGTVGAYMSRAAVNFPAGLDGGTEIAAAYRVVGLPTHFFIDAGGVLRAMRIGTMSRKAMERSLLQIVGPAATPR